MTFDDICEFQGWNVESQLNVILGFISARGLETELRDYAAMIGDYENEEYVPIDRWND